MADITATHIAAPRTNIIVQAFVKAFDFLVMIGENNARVRQLERLQAMSDAELAARGLKRDQLVRYVFSDFLYV